MLTAKQIEEANRTLSMAWSSAQDDANDAFAEAAKHDDAEDRAEFMTEARDDQRHADELKDALAALAAYERVAALAEEFHALGRKTPSGGADTRLLCEGFAQRIDRALEG